MSDQAQPAAASPADSVYDNKTKTHEWFLASFFLMLGMFLFLPERGMEAMNSFFGLGPNGLKYYAIAVLFTLPTIIVWSRQGFGNAARLLAKMLLLALTTMSLAIGLFVAFQNVFPGVNPFIALAVATLPATVLIFGFAKWMQPDVEGKHAEA